MKNQFPIPDDLYEVVLSYDGRYDKYRLMPSLRIIDIRLYKYDRLMSFKCYELYKAEIEKFAERQTRCWEQDTIFEKSPDYKREHYLNAIKYTKRCDELTGCIVGKTPIKKHLDANEKRFSNVLGCYSISKCRQKQTIDEEGISWKSQKIYGVTTGSGHWCEWGLHLSRIESVVEKNGIEILDPKFIQKAKKKKTGQELIKKLMKL